MQLTGEQINEFLSKAILESQIGEVVKAAVARSVTELSKGYNNPFDSVIRRAVDDLISKEVEATYRPALEAGIKEKMAQYMTDDVVQNIIRAATEKLSRSNY
jgi:uncharacterized membrane-anchored protein YjiN (DUF445 family)